MTTYTLTKSEIDMLLVHSGNEIRKWLRELKPNSQEPFARLAGDDVSRWLEFDSSHGTFDKPVGTPVFLHQAPISKEDMAKVLEALESNRVMARDSSGNYFNEVTPKRTLEAITVMQSAIEGMK